MNSHDKCVLMGLGKYCKIVMSVLKKIQQYGIFLHM